MFEKDINRSTPDFQQFLTYLPLILKYEGGYCDTPGDNGGATNFGVTHTDYDTYRRINGLPLQSVKLISQVEVQNIYYMSYWLADKCNQFPDGFNFLILDTAINMGVGTAAEFLWECLGMSKETYINDVIINTLKTDWSDPGKGEIITNKYVALRKARYELLGQIPHDAKFLQGWLNRLEEVVEFIMPIVKREGTSYTP